ncbi:MAG TPA: hypothetical protein VNY09_08490 [Candidatus Sulfotelmatobacter sp.]|jgi:hypothetical protein|nr:hypothetical protein [Candidatus Sulfotelmatobacter sp.]
MRMKSSYRILVIGLNVALCSLASIGSGRAQQAQPYVSTTPTEADVYCSDVITNQPVPTESYVISGENSRYKTTFGPDDEIFINRGAENRVKVGDEFEVVRAITDYMASTVWFKYQAMLSRAMGTRYADIGRLRVRHVDAKTSTAEMSLACGPIQRGDIIRPFVARPVPQFHQTKLDPFAPPSGKKTAMVVNGKDYTVLGGAGHIVYINLGSAQGVRIGDYFRVFRYQGTHLETNYQVRDTAYKAYGFGSTPVAYEWNNLPRQILGEGIVLRMGPNSSTVLLTDIRFEIFAGDYVELE